VIDGKSMSPATQGMFCGWVNAMGYAGMSVPGRPSAAGLPIGIQLVTTAGADDILLEIAERLEQAEPWKDRWPALAIAA
jgi:aspartyl-tRNA(Asn)/glutamyl-tRNA(Gln) amidotransferase subunit A